MLRLTKLRSVLLAGLAIRLVLAPFFAHPYDVFGWYTAGTNFLGGKLPLEDFLVPYQYSYFLFVFPATYLFEVLAHYVPTFSIPTATIPPVLNLQAQWGITTVPGVLFDFLVKLPLILADTLVALLLYRVVLRLTSKTELAVSAAALWYLNPGVIWVTAGWGMFDTLPALFTVVFFYFFVEQRYLLSGVALALAVALKYYAVVFFVPLLLYSGMKRHGFGVLASVMGASVSGILLAAPTIFNTLGVAAQQPGKSTSFFSGFLYIINAPSPIGLHYSGLSFWTAITLFDGNFNQTLVSTVALAVTLAVAYLLIWKRPTTTGLGDAAGFALPLLCVLLLYRVVHENFFLWVLPLLAVLSAENPKLRKITWMLGALVFVSSITDTLLPYYMLPMYPWIGSQLTAVFTWLAPFRVAPQPVLQGFCCGGVLPGVSVGKLALAAMGLASAVLLIMALIELLGLFGISFDIRTWLAGTRKALTGRTRSIPSKQATLPFPVTPRGPVLQAKFGQFGRTTSRASSMWGLDEAI